MGACVNVSYLVMGPIENNVYIVDDGTGCFVVDPSCDADRIIEALDGRELHAIVITHGHWDHTGAARELRDATGAEVIASTVETPFINGEKFFGGHTRNIQPCPVDRMVNDGDVLHIGDLDIKVIATPGHTPGGMCLLIDPTDDRPGAPVLLSGDTLFASAHGRVDFAESDPAAMIQSLARLSKLPDDTVVLPGHNNLTTIARERAWMERVSA